MAGVCSVPGCTEPRCSGASSCCTDHAWLTLHYNGAGPFTKKDIQEWCGTVNEYRCTREVLYQGRCPGRDDLAAREGHYVRAKNAAEARKTMAHYFPEDIGRAAQLGVARPFTVTLHRRLSA